MLYFFIIDIVTGGAPRSIYCLKQNYLNKIDIQIPGTQNSIESLWESIWRKSSEFNLHSDKKIKRVIEFRHSTLHFSKIWEGDGKRSGLTLGSFYLHAGYSAKITNMYIMVPGYEGHRAPARARCGASAPRGRCAAPSGCCARNCFVENPFLLCFNKYYILTILYILIVFILIFV